MGGECWGAWGGESGEGLGFGVEAVEVGCGREGKAEGEVSAWVSEWLVKQISLYLVKLGQDLIWGGT